MSVAPGTRLGPYEIVGAIGAGGMGEVYRARDTRLDRTVAIKVLPPALASDPQLRERFDREARTISQLTHPHICALYDVGHEHNIHFLVLEYLEGETLAARLDRGPLKLADALTIATQIADALDKAHRAGVVHRDLKPQNVMLTKSGVKLLDFGLAKFVGPAKAGHYDSRGVDAASRGVNPQADLTAPPTTPVGLTTLGTILGTFNYMAPEQIEGEEADARSDIFAFGVVLYEMLTGRKPFTGKTPASVMGAILKEDPSPVTALDPSLPPAVDRIIRRSLAKDPEDRWQSARDLGWELASVGRASPETQGATPLAMPRRAPAWLPWTIAGLMTIVAAGIVGWLAARPSPAPPALTHLVLPIAPGESLNVGAQAPIVAISQDGGRVAFTVYGRASTRLFVRGLDQESATPLGSDLVSGPVFSPDGEWLAYIANDKLTKVAVSGGASLTLADADPGGSRGIDWAADDWIVYSTVNSNGIMRVRASGGERERLTTVDPSKGEFGHAWPTVIPGGRAILFCVRQGSAGALWDDANIELLELEGRKHRILARGGVNARYAPSGHLVYRRGSSLLAVPFDLERLATVGSPVAVQENVAFNPLTGAGQWALADNGTLIYLQGNSVQGGSVVPQSNLVWIDGRGASSPAAALAQTFADPRLSPDGRLVAVEITAEGDEVWVIDLVRGSSTRMTFDGAEDETPEWSPDGRWIAWSATRGTARVILRRRVDGSGVEEKLTGGPEHTQRAAISGSRREVAGLDGRRRAAGVVAQRPAVVLPRRGRHDGRGRLVYADLLGGRAADALRGHLRVERRDAHWLRRIRGWTEIPRREERRPGAPPDVLQHGSALAHRRGAARAAPEVGGGSKDPPYVPNSLLTRTNPETRRHGGTEAR